MDDLMRQWKIINEEDNSYVDRIMQLGTKTCVKLTVERQSEESKLQTWVQMSTASAMCYWLNLHIPVSRMHNILSATKSFISVPNDR